MEQKNSNEYKQKKLPDKQKEENMITVLVMLF